MAKYRAKTKDCQLIIKFKPSLGETINYQDLDKFSYKKIRGLLKIRLLDKKTIEYKGPTCISLFDRLKKPINKYDFFFIIEQIVDIHQKLSTVGSMADNLVLDVNYIYINEITKEMQFIYLPILKKNKDINNEFLELIEKIIYSALPIQEKDMEYISRFVYFIKDLRIFDTKKIEKYIENEEIKVVNIIKGHSNRKSDFMTDKQMDYYAHYDNQPYNSDNIHDSEATGLLNDPSEDTGLLDNGENEETGVLNLLNTKGTIHEDVDREHKVFLYRTLTKENISINKPVFRIGKEKSYSDYFICNNDKVSRSHADIIIRGKKVFIIDLNSKNKTYVDGQMIPSQQEIELFDGNHITLANEEFELHI